MNDITIKAKLRAAGIPREALPTTLAMEGLPELREFVVDRAFDTTRLSYIYPSATADANKATLAFYLCAKEMILSGQNVFCCSLVDIHTALWGDSDEAAALESSLSSAGYIAIRHFHDAGGRTAPFMTPYETAYFNSWLLRKYQAGVGFMLLGGAPIMEAIDWWPASFLGYIRARAAIFSVKGVAHERRA